MKVRFFSVERVDAHNKKFLLCVPAHSQQVALNYFDNSLRIENVAYLGFKDVGMVYDGYEVKFNVDGWTFAPEDYGYSYLMSLMHDKADKFVGDE